MHTGYPTPANWRPFGVFNKLIAVVLPIVGAGFVLLPLIDQAFLSRLARLPGGRDTVTWLVNGSGALVIGIVLLGLWLAFLLWKRHQYVNDRKLWVDAGCPNCQERELIRVNRKRGDRYYSMIGIPTYRYACRNCTWRGLRIGRRRQLTVEEEIQREMELLRFQPDGLKYELPPAVTDLAGELAGDESETADEAEVEANGRHDEPADESAEPVDDKSLPEASENNLEPASKHEEATESEAK